MAGANLQVQIILFRAAGSRWCAERLSGRNWRADRAPPVRRGNLPAASCDDAPLLEIVDNFSGRHFAPPKRAFLPFRKAKTALALAPEGMTPPKMLRWA